MNIHAQKILILDFGSQYTQLIGRRVRDIGVYCEIHSAAMSNEDIISFNPSGIILSGGPYQQIRKLIDRPRLYAARERQQMNPRRLITLTEHFLCRLAV